MNTYRTAEVAGIIGIYPNTVRLYETLGFIPKPERKSNGYRIFTDFHIEQLKLARLALQVEVLQNGLRKKILRMVKASAAGDFKTALSLTEDYLQQLKQERANAEEAIVIVKRILSGGVPESARFFRRKEVSECLGISMDALRNWEMNGLLAVKRKRNGYRVYTDTDIQRLIMIRSLRCANYSLEAILRMLRQLSENPDTDIAVSLNTPKQDSEIISVCDRLIVSLSAAEENAYKIVSMLRDMIVRLPPMFSLVVCFWGNNEKEMISWVKNENLEKSGNAVSDQSVYYLIRFHARPNGDCMVCDHSNIVGSVGRGIYHMFLSAAGRVFGLLGAMYSGCLPVGMAIFGPMADRIPLQWIMIGSGIAMIVLSVFVRANKEMRMNNTKI